MRNAYLIPLRFAAGVALTAILYAFNGDTMFLWAAGTGAVIGLLTGPTVHFYAHASAQQKWFLFGLAALAIAGTLRLYAYALLQTRPYGTEWIAWGAVFAIPFLLGWQLVRHARRLQHLE